MSHALLFFFFASYQKKQTNDDNLIDLDNQYLSEPKNIEIVLSKSSENVMLDSNESKSLVAIVRM